MAIKRGTALKDTLLGTSLADQLFGLAGDDILFGLGGADLLDGGTGNDTLNGGAGNDTYVVDSVSDKIIDASGIDTVRTSVTLTLGAAIENGTLLGTLGLSLTGNGLANTLTGNAGNNVLSGGAGSDRLNGGLGNDTLIGGAGGDRHDGGAGIDTVNYAAEASLITIFLTNETVAGGAAGGDTFFGIENVVGTGFDDAISGNALNNTLTGGRGADSLAGLGGLDVLLGGDGDDVLLPGADSAADIVNGGDGIDTVSYQDATQGVGISLQDNLTDFGADNDVLISIENVVGSALADAIQVYRGGSAFGFDSGDTLEGSRSTGFGNQTSESLFGGAGSDAFFLHLGTGADLLMDFDGLLAGDDILVLASEFTGINTGASFVLNTEGSAQATIATAQFIYERLTDTLYFDRDGTAGGFAPELIAYLPDLGGTAVLTNDHFFII